jgi:hypothetical protein
MLGCFSSCSLWEQLWVETIVANCIAIQTHIIWVVGMFFELYVHMIISTFPMLFFTFWEHVTHSKLKGTPYKHHEHLLGTW